MNDRFDVILYASANSPSKVITSSFPFLKAVEQALKEFPTFVQVTLPGDIKGEYVEVTNSYQKKQTDFDVRLFLVEPK